MNTAEVDLDRLVDYEREYRSVVKRAQVTGDHMIGLCPFHDDSKNSFSVDLKTGRWHCFSEDIGGNYVDFVAKMNGISTKDAYKRIMEDYHVEMPEKEKPAASRRSYSMEQKLAVAAADVRIWLRPAVRTRQESRMRSQQRKKHWRDRSNNNKNCGSTKYGTIQNMQKVGKKFEKTIDISTKNDYNCQAVQ